MPHSGEARQTPRRIWLTIAGTAGALAVIVGAFGAHGLESRLTADQLDIYRTAANYHFYHALALLAVALAPASIWESRWTGRACGAWLAGIAVFSGSLYALAITDLSWLGAITPIGGLAFIAGWAMIALGQIPRP